MQEVPSSSIPGVCKFLHTKIL